MPLNEEQKKDIRFIVEDLLDVLFPCDEKERKAIKPHHLNRTLLELITYVVLSGKAPGQLVEYLENPLKFAQIKPDEVEKTKTALEKYYLTFLATTASALRNLIKEEKWSFDQCLIRSDEVTRLGNCLLYPKQYLSGIEKTNSNITVADVQLFVLSEIQARLKTFFTKLSLILSDSGLEALLTTNRSKFTSLKFATASWDNPFELKEVAHKIFFGNFIFEDDSDDGYVNVIIRIDVTLYDRVEHGRQHLRKIFFPIFRDDTEQNEYLKKLAADSHAAAKEASQRFAAHQVILNSPFTIPPHDERLKLRLYTLITTSYFYQLLMEGKLKWQKLIKIAARSGTETEDYLDERIALLCHPDTLAFLQNNPLKIDLKTLLTWTNAEIKNVCHPAIYGLISNSRVNLVSARKLPFHARQLIGNPTFFHMVSEKKLSLKKLLDVPLDHCSFVTLPSVSRLISLGILPLSVASTIPLHLAPIMMHLAYSDYFQKNTDWECFCKLQQHHVDLMLVPEYAGLFCQNKFTLTQLSRLPASLTRLLIRNPYVIKMFDTTHNYADLLLTRDQIQLSSLYAAGYFVRVYALAINSPYPIDNRENAREHLLNEIPLAADDCNLTVLDFHNCICFFLAEYIKAHLLKRYHATSNDFLKNIFSSLLSAFPSNSSSISDWSDFCQNLLKKIKHHYIMFASGIHPYTDPAKPKPEEANSLIDFSQMVLETNFLISYKHESSELVRSRKNMLS